MTNHRHWMIKDVPCCFELLAFPSCVFIHEPHVVASSFFFLFLGQEFSLLLSDYQRPERLTQAHPSRLRGWGRPSTMLLQWYKAPKASWLLRGKHVLCRNTSVYIWRIPGYDYLWCSLMQLYQAGSVFFSHLFQLNIHITKSFQQKSVKLQLLRTAAFMLQKKRKKKTKKKADMV